MGEQSMILLANRSRGTLLFDQALLQRSGRPIRLAVKGTEAWRIARETAPRVVVFSYDLDDLTGPELCRLLRDHERTRRVSLLFVGDRQAPAEADLCRAAGCNEIIWRPLHRHELGEKVARLASVPPRRNLRTITKVELLNGSNGMMLGHSVNLSASGMLLQLEEVLPPSAQLALQFFLQDAQAPIRTTSEVVRAEFTGGAPRYGVRFVDMPSSQRTEIDRFVRLGEGAA